jgi:hypothetical protein
MTFFAKVDSNRDQYQPNFTPSARSLTEAVGQLKSTGLSRAEKPETPKPGKDSIASADKQNGAQSMPGTGGCSCCKNGGCSAAQNDTSEGPGLFRENAFRQG